MASPSPRRGLARSETSSVHVRSERDLLLKQAMEGSGLDDINMFMYDDLEMHGQTRKAAQIQFYRYQVCDGAI